MAKPSLTKVVLSFAMLVILTSATQSDLEASVAESNETNDSVGLNRMKPTVSSAEQKSPAVQLNEHTANEEMEHVESEGKLGNVANIHGDSGKADDESQKVTSHEAEFRSNMSSSTKSSSGPVSSTQLHPQQADRHQGGASRPAILSNSNSHSSGEIAHEHVIRYQIHQSSEEDSEEDASFKAPASDRVHVKVPASVVVSSNSFPVRLGPNVVRIPGSSSNNAMERTTATKMKPIPVVRQEIIRPDNVKDNDSRLNQY